jgi:glutathione S-transferase
MIVLYIHRSSSSYAASFVFLVYQIPFTNTVISFPDFDEMKASLPTGQLPILDIETNGKKKVVGQSAAILRYAGKLAGLYPTDDMEAMEVDMFCDHIEDLTKGLFLSVAGSVSSFVSDTPWTKEEVLAMRLRMLDADKWGSITYVSVNILIEENLIDPCIHSSD